MLLYLLIDIFFLWNLETIILCNSTALKYLGKQGFNNVLFFSWKQRNNTGSRHIQWHPFDGKAKRLYLKHTYLIKVTEVTEYHHIESTCSKESYYECLAKRFLQYEGESNCTALQKCSPFTLPQIDGGTIPVCQSDTQASCFGQVIERLRSDQEKHCKRSCRVKEFATELDTMDMTLNESRNELYALEMKFGAQDFTRDVRSLQVMKNVKTQKMNMLRNMALKSGTLLGQVRQPDLSKNIILCIYLTCTHYCNMSIIWVP